VTTPTPQPPASAATRNDRIRDAIALLLVVAGIVVLIVAFTRNRALATQPIVLAKGQTAFSLFMRNYYLDFVGYGMVALGILVGVSSYALHARRVRRERTQRGVG
jgi:hypothetical protein